MLRRLLGVAVLATAAAAAPPVCINCHPRETNRYLASAMGRSLGEPETIPGGSSGPFSAQFRNGRLFHTINERGITAEYPVALQIGRGTKARTYAVRIGDYLLESPLSWYKAAGWDVSPGYESMQLLDFDRPVTENCLFCHADRAKATDADGRRIPEANIAAISCDRCHGPTEAHVRNPSSANIVNPAKLTGAARDSVCEQCHLEGETRVNNPGKTQWDYHAGEALEATMATWLLREPGAGRKAVTQVEELAESKCVRNSAGKLWCGSCHNPHGEISVTKVCGGCHVTTALSKTAHAKAPSECVSCHMPARPAGNVAHLAVTDHQIRRPGSSAEPAVPAPALRPWREPPAQFRQRNLALAGLRLAAEKNLPVLAAQSTRLLDAIPEAQQNSDADVLAALEVLYLGTSTPEKALALSRWAIDAEPQSATFALNYGLALMRSGSLPDAERQFRRALELDPSLMQAAVQLAVLYDRQGREAESKAAVADWLKWNPQSIQFRLAVKP
jgi:Tfp pilus assembly protein PilF